MKVATRQLTAVPGSGCWQQQQQQVQYVTCMAILNAPQQRLTEAASVQLKLVFVHDAPLLRACIRASGVVGQDRKPRAAQTRADCCLTARSKNH